MVRPAARRPARARRATAPRSRHAAAATPAQMASLSSPATYPAARTARVALRTAGKSEKTAPRPRGVSARTSARAAFSFATRRHAIPPIRLAVCPKAARSRSPAACCRSRAAEIARCGPRAAAAVRASAERGRPRAPNALSERAPARPPSLSGRSAEHAVPEPAATSPREPGPAPPAPATAVPWKEPKATSSAPLRSARVRPVLRRARPCDRAAAFARVAV